MLRRVQIVGSAGLGATLLAAFLVAPDRASAIASLTGPWWAWICGSVVVSGAAALLLIAGAQRPGLLAPVAYGCAAAYTVVTATWFLGWNGELAPRVDGGGLDLWATFVPQVLGCVLVLSRRLPSALAVIIVSGTVCLTVTSTASGDFQWIDLVDAMWILVLICVYQVIGWAVVSGARRLDQQRAEFEADAGDRRRRAADRAEQRRIDAMVHDRLIALLLSLRPGRIGARTGAAAGALLDELDQWHAEPGHDRLRMSAAELSHRLRLTADEYGSGVHVDVVVEGAETYPASVGHSLIDATGEAIRNFHRHAGAGASCAVLGELRSEEISVIVVDDGVGFEPGAVPPNRIGVALGIVDRMQAVDGGDVYVDSTRGVGTRVDLTWTAPTEAS